LGPAGKPEIHGRITVAEAEQQQPVQLTAAEQAAMEAARNRRTLRQQFVHGKAAEAMLRAYNNAPPKMEREKVLINAIYDLADQVVGVTCPHIPDQRGSTANGQS